MDQLDKHSTALNEIFSYLQLQLDIGKCIQEMDSTISEFKNLQSIANWLSRMNFSRTVELANAYMQQGDINTVPLKELNRRIEDMKKIMSFKGDTMKTLTFFLQQNSELFSNIVKSHEKVKSMDKVLILLMIAISNNCHKAKLQGNRSNSKMGSGYLGNVYQ
jgi:DNA repair ATPase RecN